MDAAAQRTVELIGEGGYAALRRAYVAVVGLGGVGGHCAEALARAGIGKLHLVDGDAVAASNLNRQIVATYATVGMRKTAAMEARLRSLWDGSVSTEDRFITGENAEACIPPAVDFIVDAVDDMGGKLALIGLAAARGTPIVSCMGAGNRLDPTRFAVRDVFSTQGDPLARRMRAALRKLGVAELPVVFSDEPPRVKPGQRVIGSLAPVTAAAGLCAAGYVLNCLLQQADEIE